MAKLFKRFISLIICVSLFLVSACYLNENIRTKTVDAVSSVTNAPFFKRSGVNLITINSSYELGSTTSRIAKVWMTDADISGSFTLGGTVGTGGIDMNGEVITNIGNAGTDFTSAGGLTTAGAINIDKDVTNANNTTTGMTIVNTSVVTDAGTYTKTGGTLSITSNVTETSGTITDSGILASFTQSHADATGAVASITNAGTGNGLFIDQNGNGIALNIDSEATTADGVVVDSSAITSTSASAVKTIVISAQSVISGLSVRNGTGGMRFYSTVDSTGGNIVFSGTIITTTGNTVPLTITSDSVSRPSSVFGSLNITTLANSRFYFMSALKGTGQTATEIMSIELDGKVGIGMTTPSAKLDIVATDAENFTGLEINQQDTGTSLGATITNAGTGNGILIDQDGVGVALNIDSEATTANGIYGDFQVMTTGNALTLVVDTDAMTTGKAIQVLGGADHATSVFSVGPAGNTIIGGNLIKSVTATITASTGSAQGGSPLTKDYNEISVCATAGDSVTLPTAVAGLQITITNHGAESADVFPATDDAINEAAANTAKALAADASMTCFSYDVTNWECLTLAR